MKNIKDAQGPALGALDCVACARRGHCLPAGLDQSGMQLYLQVGRPQQFCRGQHLFNAGEPAEWIWVLRTGALKTWVTSLDGGMQVLGFHSVGSLVGLDGLVDSHYHARARRWKPA